MSDVEIIRRYEAIIDKKDGEIDRLKADKRELVDACELAKSLIESEKVSFTDSIRKTAIQILTTINKAVGKHKEGV
jgi:hypothetical protein